MSTYPIAIIEDRYGGVYSGGRWIAIARWEDDASGQAGRDEYISRLRYVEQEGNGDDMDAMQFWSFDFSTGGSPRHWWVAVGGTPDEALAALKDRWTKHQEVSATRSGLEPSSGEPA